MGHPRINGHFCGCATCSYIQVSTVASLVARKNPSMRSLVPWLSVAVLEMGTGSSPELGTALP